MAEIVLNFNLTGGEGSSGETTTGETAKTPQAKENAKTALTVHQAFNVAKQLGNQVVDGFIGNIGLTTGNYTLQEELQTAKSVATKVVGVAVSFAANPVLGAINLVSEGISTGISIYQQQVNTMWQNREAEQMRRRAGYNSNGNR